ncbi:MAG: methylthioribulose 1-phosphate dehydratase [Planctomycetes bacterium]|nr:methylthioribulose 1-phosphate dehydratase [Planctomycetota bacterium]
MHHLDHFSDQIEGLRRVGHQLWTRGWSLGTSSNYSVVVERDPLRLIITASGKDKGHLGPHDFVMVDEDGKSVVEGQSKSSAETMLHCLAARQGAGAVLHTHSVWGTLLSNHFAAVGGIRISGFEMLKGLEGITTHESSCWIPIFENTQDIPALARQVETYLQSEGREPCWAYLIRKHGMYTWGRDLAEATRHIEVIEFLLECLGRTTRLV